MLADLQRNGLDAVRRFARELDHDDHETFELDREAILAAGDALQPALRAAIELGAARTRRFGKLTREHMSDFETELQPGLVTGTGTSRSAASAPTCRPGASRSPRARS